MFYFFIKFLLSCISSKDGLGVSLLSATIWFKYFETLFLVLILVCFILNLGPYSHDENIELYSHGTLIIEDTVVPFIKKCPFSCIGVNSEAKKARTRRDICTWTFIESFFAVAQRGKHCKCPQPDKWINSVAYGIGSQRWLSSCELWLFF